MELPEHARARFMAAAPLLGFPRQVLTGQTCATLDTHALPPNGSPATGTEATDASCDGIPPSDVTLIPYMKASEDCSDGHTRVMTRPTSGRTPALGKKGPAVLRQGACLPPPGGAAPSPPVAPSAVDRQWGVVF